MSKTKLAVETEFGTFTRTTARTYTHLVIVRGNKGAREWLERNKAELGDYRPETVAHYRERAERATWGAMTWCGRLDLAQKEASKWSKHYDEVRIVAVPAEAYAAK